MNVAISSMAKVNDRYLILVGNGVNLADHLRHLAARHADVLVELVRVDLAQGR